MSTIRPGAEAAKRSGFQLLSALTGHDHLTPGAPYSNDLVRELDQWMRGRARGLTETAGRIVRLPHEPGGAPAPETEDAIQDQLQTLLARKNDIREKMLDGLADHPLRDEAVLRAALSDEHAALLVEIDRRFSAYVGTMLANAFLSQKRKHRRELLADDRSLDDPGAPLAGASKQATSPTVAASLPKDEARDQDALLHRFHEVCERAEAGLSRGDYRASFHETLQNMILLFADDLTMDDLIARERAASPPEDASGETLRDRVLQRHSRVRGILAKTVSALRSDHVIDEDVHARLLLMIDAMLRRCQRPTRGASPRSKGAVNLP